MCYRAGTGCVNSPALTPKHDGGATWLRTILPERYNELRAELVAMADARDSGLLAHARRELPEPTDEMQQWMNDHLLGMVAMFALEGHSGFSASYAQGALRQLPPLPPTQPAHRRGRGMVGAARR